MSQVGRRLARKTSAMGLASMLVLFACAVLAWSPSAQAAADKTMEVTYDCVGGSFVATGVKVTITAPDTVAPSGTASIKWTLPTTLTATSTVAANTPITIEGSLTIGGGGTPASLTKTHSGTMASGNTYTPSPATMEATVTAPASGTVTITPGTVNTTKGFKITAGASGSQQSVTECTYKSATPATGLSMLVQAGGGNGNGTDIVAYVCDVPTGTTDTNYPTEADVDIKVVMTPPTSASANADASITWTGTIQTTGDTLKAPQAWPASGAKLFATIKATGAGAPATATGEGSFTTTIQPGADITTLPSVTIKVKPTTTGTVSLTAGDLAFGTSSTSPVLRCTAPTTGLKAYTFTVGASTSPSPTTTSPTPTNTSPRPTTTRTSTVTVTPTSSTTRRSQTPKAGADTGAGGMMGPDGRLFILTGTALVGAAAVGGLLMRRRSIKG